MRPEDSLRVVLKILVDRRKFFGEKRKIFLTFFFFLCQNKIKGIFIGVRKKWKEKAIKYVEKRRIE